MWLEPSLQRNPQISKTQAHVAQRADYLMGRSRDHPQPKAFRFGGQTLVLAQTWMALQLRS